MDLFEALVYVSLSEHPSSSKLEVASQVAGTSYRALQKLTVESLDIRASCPRCPDV